jgi:hypothetical protein
VRTPFNKYSAQRTLHSCGGRQPEGKNERIKFIQTLVSSLFNKYSARGYSIVVTEDNQRGKKLEGNSDARIKFKIDL